MKNRGFTLLELAIFVSIMAVLMMTFLNRVMYYQEQAERAAMIGVVVAVQDALTLQQARLRILGDEAGMVALRADNPINWLAEKPGNYGGEFYDPSTKSVTRGSWVYDLKAHELIYFPEHTSHLVFSGEAKKWIRYRVSLGQGGSSIALVKGNIPMVTFDAVEPYHWEN
jgi:general secretion pathway protein G